jgi:cytosine deaminase
VPDVSVSQFLRNLDGAPVKLGRAAVPGVFLKGATGSPAPERELQIVDLEIANGRIQRIAPSGTLEDALDLQGRVVFPRLVDMHTHLDKSQVLARIDNPDFTLDSARNATIRDRAERWTRNDLRRRIEFSLRAAEHHGVGAIRTHLDSQPELSQRSWELFAEIRAEWKDRIALQAVSLLPLFFYETPYGAELADRVAAYGGAALGAATPDGETVSEEGRAILNQRLRALFQLAEERGLDIDLHVDETNDTSLETLSHIAKMVLETRFTGKVTCGHCCSLALVDEEPAGETMALIRQANLAIVTLPIVNLHLQDRNSKRTPRWRGVPPVRELQDAGIRVAMAGDNCRDAWFSYGDGDMVDTLRQGMRILHLDDRLDCALAMTGPVPANICGFADSGVITHGGPADLIVFEAKKINHLLSRPTTERTVIRAGKALSPSLPDYEELEATF